MSQRAREYVLGLPPRSVTLAERFVLSVIAENYQDRFSSANFELELLCEETGLSRRHLRRLLVGLQRVLEYRPGVGAGRFGQFRFPEMPEPLRAVEIAVNQKEKGDRKGTERGQKGDIFDHAIRKDLNLKQDQKQNPPNPLFSKGGTLTAKQISRLRRRMLALEKDWNRRAEARVGTGSSWTFEQLIHVACDQELIPFADAYPYVTELWQENHNTRLRKAPQSA